MKFKLNDKVKMQANTLWWQQGDVGRIVDIDEADDSLPYEICLNSNCTAAWRCTYENTQWVKESDIQLAHQLIKVE